MTRTVSALFLAAGFALGMPLPAALAVDPDPAAKSTATPPTAPAAATPAEPTGRPVPSDLPVVNKAELEGGLIAEDLKIGDGYEVKPGGAVVAYYHGTLKSDGSVFDSAFQRGQPVSFPLAAVIPGWQKGVPGMKVGGIRRLIIPAAMAYGEQGRPGIPANSDLVFIIELVGALEVTDVTVGEGEEVGPQPICVTAHTIKTVDGKEIESATKDRPGIWAPLPGEFQGMMMGLSGMKVGGKRTFTVPKEMNTAGPLPTDRPTDVPLVIEVELIAVRNLVPPRS